jgi:predicted phage replisome organizer
MAEVKWIQIVTDIFDNRKIKQIERMPEGDAIIVVWFKILCLAGKCNKNGMMFFTDEIPYTEDMLATEFGMEQPQRFNVLKLAIRTFEQFKMIEIIDDIFCISSWERYQNIAGLEKIREQNRIRQARFKGNKKQLPDNVNSNVTDNAQVTHSNATDIDKEIDINIYNRNIVQSDCTSNPSKASKVDIELLFDSLWKLYPNKKGKGQVSDARKKKLHDIGMDELTRAIERYQAELAKDSWRVAQNGSTFFNSGYVDYLDANYVPSNQIHNQAPANKAASQNKFNQFPQRNYTKQQYADLEKKLLSKGLQEPKEDI